MATENVERIEGPAVWRMIDEYAEIFGLPELEASDVVRFGYVPDSPNGALELVVFQRNGVGERVGKITYKREIDTSTVKYNDWATAN